MDDMRERYRTPRRDYSEPARRPLAPSSRPLQAPTPVHQPQSATPPVAHHQHPEPRPHHVAPAQPHRRPKKGRFIKYLAVLLVLAALAGGGYFVYHKHFVKNPFPADIRQNDGIDLLYPAKLPAGYQVDLSSINRTNGILIYDATSGNQRLVFTIQKTPSTFDFATFYKQQMQGLQQFTTPYGQAAIGKNSGRYLGSLVDGGTWLLLSTNNTALNGSDYRLILNNLKKY